MGSGALIGTGYCNELFAIERRLAELSFDEHYTKRRELAQPILDGFLTWLEIQNRHLVKNALGKAVRYTLDQWPYLERYLLDGRLEISNNRAENSIRPFVIGRKNFLFANTPGGAKASAVMYSVVETAKANGLNPYEYLAYLFRTMPSGANLSDLLPGSKSLPQSCFCPRTEQEKHAWEGD